MPIIKFSDFDTYGKAIAMLLRRGCMLEARDKMKLVVTLPQEEALKDAGLLDNAKRMNGSTQKRAKTKKKKKA